MDVIEKQKLEPGVYEIRVPGTPVPQGRPKFTSVGKGVRVYYGKTSKAYRALLDKEFAEMFELIEPTSSPCSITIEAWGMKRNADPDNLAKQIMDAMVGPILVDDNWTVVRQLTIMCFPAPDPNERGVKITLHVWQDGCEI